MKATGIIRRIDDLGRVVIPKEIRRRLRMREDEPLEIYVGNDGEIIFKKYNAFVGVELYAEQYAKALFDTSGYTVMFCNRDYVTAVAGWSHLKGLKGQPISQELIDKANDLSKSLPPYEGKRILPVDGKPHEAIAYVPIVVDKATEGYIALLAHNIDDVAGDSEIKLLRTAAKFIASLLEG